MLNARPQILVAAYGNELAGDDSFGPLVVKTLQAIAPVGVAIVSLGMRPASLLDHLAQCSALCVVDAARCDHLPAGTLIEMDFLTAARPALVHDASLSSHGLSVAAELELARRLGMCPQVVWLVAAAAGSTELGRSAGPEVLRQVPVAARHIAEWAKNLRLT